MSCDDEEYDHVGGNRWVRRKRKRLGFWDWLRRVIFG